MACSKCKKNKCCCPTGGSTPAQLQAQVDVLQETVNTLVESTKFLRTGHPILMIEKADDINLFDPTTKLGSGDWEGWAMCVGNTHQNPVTKAFITTPNLIDRFVVMATGTYAVGDTGGADTVQLTADQNGTHTHAVTDAGHTHNVTDPGHNHGVTDNGHAHTGATAAHSHTFTTDTEAAHTHALTDGSTIVSSANGGDYVSNLVGSAEVTGAGTTLASGGAHEHAGTTDNTAATLVIANANTGVAVDNAFIGITETENEVTGITLANSGLGEAHENRPPYYAVIFIQKVF